MDRKSKRNRDARDAGSLKSIHKHLFEHVEMYVHDTYTYNTRDSGPLSAGRTPRDSKERPRLAKRRRGEKRRNSRRGRFIYGCYD